MVKNKNWVLMSFFLVGMVLVIIEVVGNLLSHLW